MHMFYLSACNGTQYGKLTLLHKELDIPGASAITVEGLLH